MNELGIEKECSGPLRVVEFNEIAGCEERDLSELAGSPNQLSDLSLGQLKEIRLFRSSEDEQWIPLKRFINIRRLYFSLEELGWFLGVNHHSPGWVQENSPLPQVLHTSDWGKHPLFFKFLIVEAVNTVLNHDERGSTHQSQWIRLSYQLSVHSPISEIYP